jgi:hypothetical protein
MMSVHDDSSCGREVGAVRGFLAREVSQLWCRSCGGLDGCEEGVGDGLAVCVLCVCSAEGGWGWG